MAAEFMIAFLQLILGIALLIGGDTLLVRGETGLAFGNVVGSKISNIVRIQFD